MRFPITHTCRVAGSQSYSNKTKHAKKSPQSDYGMEKIETKRKAWRVAAIIRIRTINEFI